MNIIHMADCGTSARLDSLVHSVQLLGDCITPNKRKNSLHSIRLFAVRYNRTLHALAPLFLSLPLLLASTRCASIRARHDTFTGVTILCSGSYVCTADRFVRRAVLFTAPKASHTHTHRNFRNECSVLWLAQHLSFSVLHMSAAKV